MKRSEEEFDCFFSCISFPSPRMLVFPGIYIFGVSLTMGLRPLFYEKSPNIILGNFNSSFSFPPYIENEVHDL